MLRLWRPRASVVRYASAMPRWRPTKPEGAKHMKITTAIGALACALLLPVTGASAQTVLNVNSWVPPSHLLVADVTMPFCKDVETATQGRVKCNLLPKAVVSAPQTFDAVKDGLADLSFSVHGYTPGRF